MAQFLLSPRAKAFLDKHHEEVTHFTFTVKGDSINTTARGFYYYLYTLIQKALGDKPDIEYECRLESRPTYTVEKCFSQLEGKFRGEKYTFSDGAVMYTGLQSCIYGEDPIFLMTFFLDFYCTVPVQELMWTVEDEASFG